MKTIVIAIDFSTAAHNAAVYGVSLAKDINAKIILFTAYKVSSPAPAMQVGVSPFSVMVQTESRLSDEAKTLHPGKITVDIIAAEGDADNAIVNIAIEKKADLIIAGMKGSGKNLKKLLGSTAASLAAISTIPVLIIPENASYEKPGIILCASDAKQGAIVIPEYLQKFSNLFNSRIYAVRIIKNEKLTENETPEKPIINTSGPITTVEYFTNADITHGLVEVIDLYHASILAMLPHRHDWVERIFIKSETREMIFYSPIPLMVLPADY